MYLLCIIVESDAVDEYLEKSTKSSLAVPLKKRKSFNERQEEAVSTREPCIVDTLRQEAVSTREPCIVDPLRQESTMAARLSSRHTYIDAVDDSTDDSNDSVNDAHLQKKLTCGNAFNKFI